MDEVRDPVSVKGLRRAESIGRFVKLERPTSTIGLSEKEEEREKTDIC